MTDDTTTDTAATEVSDDTATEVKAKAPKKVSVHSSVIDSLATGLNRYEKTSFVMIGHRSGVRLALPKTECVSRLYFYGDGDYSLVPKDDAITVFTEEQRKEQRKGGIMAEVNFELGAEDALRAITKLVDVVRAAPEPVAKTVKPKPAKKEKALAVPKANDASDDSADVQDTLDADGANSQAQLDS